MGPLPYPHRVSFLASALTVAADQRGLAPYLAKLVSVIVFDQLIRHPVVALGDLDDERLTDDADQLLDARHPQIEDSIDWLFRISRRHEVLWFELSFDRARPAAPVLFARRPSGSIEQWVAGPDLALSQQLAHCLAQWLRARRLPAAGAMPNFTRDDVRSAAERLVVADDLLVQGRELGIVPRSLTQAPQRLPVPFLRVLSELSRDEARTIDPIILRIDPSHPVARRNRYVTDLVNGQAERRAILPLIAEAPMYGKPHLSVWGDAFAGDRPLEGMGVRHQGIAASLLPANPYACHNYSLQLGEHGRCEESYRWADRATVVAPQLGAAQLDCVRRLRQTGRRGQAFAEAQYRHREILDRAAAGKLSPGDWQAPHQAGLLVAFVHLDVGRLSEAIELASEVIAELPDDAAARDTFAWAGQRIAQWKADPGALARGYAQEGYYRGDVGRVLHGLPRAGIADDHDAMMLLDALCSVGRADDAVVGYWQLAGISRAGDPTGDVLGDGKARLAAARALILTGDLDRALDQIQIVQLRNHQSRLEAEINRLLRLAAIRPARDWERAVEQRLERGAITLAQLAARDLCDFVPGLDTPIMRRALGERAPLAIDPVWIAELIAALPAAGASSAAIISRLAPPPQATLAAADALIQDWWRVLIPAARDRDGHAAGAVLALGLALANYLAFASRPASPIAGAYRHIATEALHLVRRSRYQIEPAAVIAVLRMIDWLGDAPDWLLDPWLLRVERALDLEAEHGSYLAAMIADMPNVSRLLRGDERIGWELRLAHDLASDPSQYEPAARLFARSARAVEAGGVWRAWSAAAAAAAAIPPTAALDIQWTAALANPRGAAPWLRLAHALLGTGRRDEGFGAACRGIAALGDAERPAALAELAPHWTAAQIATPLDGAAAFGRGLAATSTERLEVAVDHLRWAAAVEPGNVRRGHSLATVLVRLGRGTDAVHALAPHEPSDAALVIGRALAERGHGAEAVRILRYAALGFRTASDWATLAGAAHRAGDDRLAAEASARAIALGATDPELQRFARPAPAEAPGSGDDDERQACAELEAGRFEPLIGQIGSASWGIARAALAACEFRPGDDSGLPVAPRALDAAAAILARTGGATEPGAALARIQALRIRDNAFIQLDPPPPLGARLTPEQFEREFAERQAHPPPVSTSTAATIVP
jgi:hypothetical protein